MGSSILMFVLIIAIFYFFMFRPQQKRQKEIENFRNGLQVGQDVVTSGGIYGKVKAIENGIVSVEVAHGVVIRFDKSAIYAVGTTQEAK